MKKKIISRIRLTAFIGVSRTTLVSADNTEMGNGEIYNNGQNVEMISASKNIDKIKQFGLKDENRIFNYTKLKEFLSTDLSQEQIDEIKKLIENSKLEIDSLKDNFSTIGTGADMNAIHDKRISIIESFAESLKGYIAENRIDDYNQFVTSEIDRISKRMEEKQIKRDDNQIKKENKKRILPQKGLLSDNIKKIIDNKLDNLDPKVKKRVFTALITKINTIIEKTKVEKTKNILIELRDYIQNKLDSFNSESTIDKILNDSTLTQ